MLSHQKLLISEFWNFKHIIPLVYSCRIKCQTGIYSILVKTEQQLFKSSNKEITQINEKNIIIFCCCHSREEYRQKDKHRTIWLAAFLNWFIRPAKTFVKFQEDRQAQARAESRLYFIRWRRVDVTGVRYGSRQVWFGWLLLVCS